MKRIAQAAGRLGRDEEGASLVFAAITLWTLALSIAYVYQIGVVSADRMQIQNAADAAAYSAALVEANSLNAIGNVNDGMAYLNYLNLRFTVDAVVYGTLNAYEYHNPAAKDNLAYVQMGGSDSPQYEGPARFEHTRNFMQSKFSNAKQWVEDLHEAGRVIMATTPRLARKTAIEVAKFNGAEKVAFSEDMEKAFTVQGDSSSSEKGQGFGERNKATGDEFEPSMYKRYAEREVSVISDAANDTPKNESMDLPEEGWFNPATGRMNGTYSQTRLCWNAKDWEHEGHTTMHGTTTYAHFVRGSPNNHWHVEHPHLMFIEFPPYVIVLGPHGGGGSNGDPGSDQPGGHYIPEDDAPEIHNEADDLAYRGLEGYHHNVNPCYTCDSSPGSMWSEVEKTSSEAREQVLKDNFNLEYGAFPRPLMMRPQLLETGLTVVTWRKARGLGDTYPASKWGMIAVASAAVGYQTDSGVLPLESVSSGRAQFAADGTSAEMPVLGGGGDDPNYRNLFYGKKASDGVRFGARLVPVAWQYANHPDLNYQSLGDLLGGSRWYDVGSPDSAGSAPTGLAELEKVVKVDSDDALKAFWH